MTQPSVAEQSRAEPSVAELSEAEQSEAKRMFWSQVNHDK